MSTINKTSLKIEEIYDRLDFDDDQIFELIKSDEDICHRLHTLENESERLKNEIEGLKEVIQGPNGVMEQLASLHELAKKGSRVIRSVIESISGVPATLKLKDGTAWKLNHFLFMNFHIWGWKQGDKVKITENDSRFSTMAPYIIENLTRGGTSSGYALSDI